MTWHQQAACRGANPTMFFPEKGNVTGARQARQICATCPVTAPCLEQALLDRETEGIWGNTTPKERRVLRRLVPGGVVRRYCIECGREFLGQSQERLCSDECRHDRNCDQRRAARRLA